SMWVDTRLPRQRKNLSQTVDDGRDQKITAQLDEIGFRRLFVDGKGLLPHGVEQRLTTGHNFPRAGCNNEKLAGSGSIRPTKDRRRNVVTMGPCMLQRQVFG